MNVTWILDVLLESKPIEQVCELAWSRAEMNVKIAQENNVISK